ncbi:host specificity protein J [Vibrio casei]|uniref:host specificity protein J n=1 Tax=Vibrio casei TaxID=673372 RepID=UPI00097E8AAC|nr:phage tail protein [Vibrio casei]SJN24491.1 Phage tail fiber protein [Vibrio casei]
MSVEIKNKKGGFRVIGSGGGGKAGESARTPVESPDSLHNTSYATTLDVIGNGEMFGPVHSDEPLRDIYLDGTPIQNDDGTLNFSSVEVDYRVGTVDQEHISGFPASSSVSEINQELTEANAWTQLLTNSDLSAVRVSLYVPQLLQTIDSGDNAGDRVGYKVSYAIDLSTDGGSFVNVLEGNIEGKTVNGYTRTHRINLDSGSQWTIRVRRTSPESESTTIQDSIYVQTLAQVIDGKFRHPMSALVGMKIDAEQFSSIPTRSFHWKGQIIRVPSNYDPINRTYTGTWDGTFKRAWSDNPAWVFYDMVTSNLYGLGDYVNAGMVDRYALYQISAYCDQLIDDGQGGTEPRFTCNVYIQSQQDALRVLNDLSSIFRGMSYWSNGMVVPVADMPSDPIYTYTNANVIDGRFEYSGSDISTRKTVALVSWNDPDDFYRSKVEAVEDSDGIARYGIRKTDVIAFGCSSRGQAQRVGLYILYTSRMETGSATFKVGLDGVIPQPGSIIKVADRNRAGRNIGGRIRSADRDWVIVDRDHPAKIGDQLTVNMPDGTVETRQISAIDDRKITVNSSFSVSPASQSGWVIDADDLVTQPIRVISVKEEDEITYSIMGVFHHPDKYSAIDNGVRLDPLPVSVVPPRTQTAPTNIIIQQHYSFHQGTTRHWAEISWDAPENAVLYDVQWRRDNGGWVIMSRTGTRLVQIDDIFAGTYTVRIRAINSLDVPSLWAYSSATLLDGMAGAPPVLTSLTTSSEVMAITVNWTYPDTPNIISKVELVSSLTNSFDDSFPVTQAPYPAVSHTMYGLGYGTEMWFWARLIDKNGLAGEWMPLSTGAGTYGKSSESASDILDYLQGQISGSELAQDLVAEIGKIDGIEIDMSGIETQITDIESDMSGIETQITDIESDMSGIETQITNETQLRESADSALASDISTVAATASDNTAAIQSEATARADADSALASDISTVAATASDNTAAIQSEATARADADSALAQSVSTLQSSVDDNEALIQQTSQALADIDGSLNANWQVKTEVRSDGRVVQAGVAIGASINPDGTSRSEALFMADTVAFLTKLDGELHAPFIFDVVNDTAILNSAIIGNASIGFAKIQNDIQSDNYAPGDNGGGWKIDKNGNAEFNTGNFRGTVYAKNISGDLINGTVATNSAKTIAANAWGNVLAINVKQGDEFPKYLTVISPTSSNFGRKRIRLRGSGVSTVTVYNGNTDNHNFSISCNLPARFTGIVYLDMQSYITTGSSTIESLGGWTVLLGKRTGQLTVS